jgi:hypothetical protein
MDISRSSPMLMLLFWCISCCSNRKHVAGADGNACHLIRLDWPESRREKILLEAVSLLDTKARRKDENLHVKCHKTPQHELTAKA